MISQNCPKCSSNRVRQGYRPTPIWSKVLFRYNLLCDACNWEFTGFAVPGTVSHKPTRRVYKYRVDEIQEETDQETPPNEQPPIVEEQIPVSEQK